MSEMIRNLPASCFRLGFGISRAGHAAEPPTHLLFGEICLNNRGIIVPAQVAW